MAADEALQAEIAALRADLAPAWLARAAARRGDRRPATSGPQLQSTFIDLVRGSVADYLARFGFKSELLVSMYAVTDGLSGLNAGPDDPGTGHNFLVHNMCRLPGSDGTWMIAEGGMGTVSAHVRRRRPRRRAPRSSPARRSTAVTVDGGAASGVVLADGRSVAARVVLGALRPVPADGPGAGRRAAGRR